MEAGRELDALIAERLFEQQITWQDGEPIVTSGSGPIAFMNGTVEQETDGIWLLGGTPIPLHYSTDIRDAWGLLPYFNNRVSLYGPTASVWNEYNNGPEWTCEITVGRFIYSPVIKDDVGITASAPTAPLAICLAALKAIA